MLVYTEYINNQILNVTLEVVENWSKFQFYGNYEHLSQNKEMYHVVGDVIELDPTYTERINNALLIAGVNYIRAERKPLLRAFDTLEFKRKFILDGYIAVGEFPFIDEMTEDRWLEIKAWRNQLRDLAEGDLLNVVFPETPQEVIKFL